MERGFDYTDGRDGEKPAPEKTLGHSIAMRLLGWAVLRRCQKTQLTRIIVSP